MASLLFIGCDVHSKTISLDTFDRNSNTHSHQTKINNDPRLIWKYAKKIESEVEPGTKLVFGYEAGCLGFSFHERITKMGFECRVMAPTTIRLAQTDRVRKTDRRDAKSLAEALAYDTYKSVYVPNQEDQEVRSFIRLCEETQETIKKFKQRINAFVLKLGYTFDEGKSKWTIKHRDWLKSLELSPMNREVLDEYLITLEELETKIARYDERITEMSKQENYNELASSLSCFKGVTRPIAMRIITEIGDFNRFATAGEFASYLGLTPSEYSSGESQVKGSLTKMGNGHVRKTLIEAAQSATKGVPGRKSKRLIARQSGNDPKVIHYADKGNTRFISKFKSMMNNGKNRNIAIAACAREMACFIWGMATNHIENRSHCDPLTGEILSQNITIKK